MFKKSSTSLYTVVLLKGPILVTPIAYLKTNILIEVSCAVLFNTYKVHAILLLECDHYKL